MNKYIHSIQVYITKGLFKVFKTFFCIFQGFSRIIFFQGFQSPYLEFKVFHGFSRFFKVVATLSQCSNLDELEKTAKVMGQREASQFTGIDIRLALVLL